MRVEAAQDIIGKLTRATTPTLPCPNGDATLVTVTVRVCEIDICPRCHSVWLDRNEALSIAHCFKESSAIVAAEQGSQGIAPAWTGVMIVDTVLNALALIFR